MFTFQQISKLISSDILSFTQDASIDDFVFDSRNMISSPSALFLAIKGYNHDGHKYINELANRGIKNFIVEKEISPPPVSNVLLVPDTIRALQDLARHHRRSFNLPVIGITGSNGKTIIKEWLSQVLSKKFNIVKSPKSYNSQLGVPLSVLKIKQENSLGIFEAGISKGNEMEFLREVIRPDYGIFTNLGSAHDSGFASRKEKAREKWKLFQGARQTIYCKDHLLIDLTKPKGIECFTWGKDRGSDILILREEIEAGVTKILLKIREKEVWVDLPFRERAYIENAMHVVALCLLLDLPWEFIRTSLLELTSVSMRLEIKKGINQCILIDDTYNNDLAGIASAIEFLQNQSLDKKKTIVVSDILSSGSQNEVNKELIGLINHSGLDRVITVGEQLKVQNDLFRCKSLSFDSTDDFMRSIQDMEFSNEAILIKGARPFEFEKITRLLSEKVHGTKLEINLNALSHNLNFYKSMLKPGVKIMVMVKAFAYGSGSTEVANLLQFHNIDYLAVAYPDEGVSLRKQGISAPVMVMNVTRDSFEKLMDYRLEPELYSFQIFNEFSECVQHKKAVTHVHLKIDTGMKRLGFEEGDIDRLIELLKANPGIKVASIFTHLAGSDEDVHNEFSLQQLKLFTKISEKIIGSLTYRPMLHALNSPGIIRFSDHQMDMVRLGIGLYGYESCGIHQDKLLPISTLKTEISQIKELKKGETVGYGRRGQATRDSKIATIAIGYADGFNRAFSNGKIPVRVNGKMAPVIGNICMDMTMIDITGIDAKVGDEVVIFGGKPTIQDLASAIGTIPYEILTNVSERVKRVYYSE